MALKSNQKLSDVLKFKERQQKKKGMGVISISRKGTWALLGVCILIMASCAGFQNVMDQFSELDENSAPAIGGTTSEVLLDDGCPRIEIVEELGAINEFTNPRRPVNANLISRVDLNSADSTCEYGRNSVTVDLKLVFEGLLGPKGRIRPDDKPFFSYPFFVAVTSPSGQILAKEVFAASLTYDAGQEEQIYYESLRQIIPVRGKRSGSRHKIMIGFQLTEDQLAFNRLLLERVQTMQIPVDQPEGTSAVIEPVRSETPDRMNDAPIDLRPPAQPLGRE